MDDAVGPDRNRLLDHVRLVWDESQPESGGTRPLTVAELAQGSPYSEEQVRDHLVAGEGDTYALDRDGGDVRLVSLR